MNEHKGSAVNVVSGVDCYTPAQTMTSSVNFGVNIIRERTR